MTASGDAWSDQSITDALADPRRGLAGESAQALLQVADTGARPVLAVAHNGRRYWMKWPGNPHGNLSLVHELVVGRIGALIGAPIRPTALVYVDDALVRDSYANGIRLPGGTYVGSEMLRDVEESTQITRVARDGNSERFAYYLALWDLCLGTDLQLLYHLAERDRVWSIDHGLWFDSIEGDWTPDLLAARVKTEWPWPEEVQLRSLQVAALSAAAESVDGLSCDDLARTIGEVPLEVGCGRRDLTHSGVLRIFPPEESVGKAP
ncbi:HipA family kinase [Kribbella sp. NBC_00359]|uniref:HipA family kinase n=1 Tax=Kribbella sp. NBC_00359 TaxID=2975966 RepID=UPI002E1FA665